MTNSFWDRVAAPWSRLAGITDANGNLTRVDLTGRANGRPDAAQCLHATTGLQDYFARRALGGYTGGLEIERTLLTLEGQTVDGQRLAA
jgi:hypothetical protein